MQIEGLKVLLGLDKTEYNRGLSTAKAEAKAFGDGLQRIGNFIGAAMLGQFAKDAISFGANIKDAAEELRVGTDDLQKFQFEALSSSVSVDVASNALVKLSQNIGNARTEGGESAEKFDRLGISLYKAGGQAKTSLEVFYDIVDAVSKMSSGEERNTVLMDLMGKRAYSLSKMMNEGSDALKKFSEHAPLISEKDLESLDQTQIRLDKIKHTLLSWAGQGQGYIEFAAATYGKLFSGAEKYAGLDGLSQAVQDTMDDGNATKKVAAGSSIGATASKYKLTEEQLKNLKKIQAETNQVKEKALTIDQKISEKQDEYIAKFREGRAAKTTFDFAKAYETQQKIAAEITNLITEKEKETTKEKEKQTQQVAKQNDLERERGKLIGDRSEAFIDRSRLSPDEIREMPWNRRNRYGNQLKRTQNQIDQAEWKAKNATAWGNERAAEFWTNRSLDLRGTMGALTSSERDPMATMNKSIVNIERQLGELKVTLTPTQDRR